MRAFDAGWKSGADYVELDVRRTKDGVLVIHHDPQLADGRKIRDLTFAQLPALPDGQPIPTLTQVVDEASARHGRIAVEIKEPGYEDRVLAAISGKLAVDQFDIISFHPAAIERIEHLNCSVRTGLIGPYMRDWMRRAPFARFATWMFDVLAWHPTVRQAVRVGADYVSMYYRMATPSFIADAHREGMQVAAWTADRPLNIVAALEHGVDGVVSNNAPLALRLRDSFTGSGQVVPAVS